MPTNMRGILTAVLIALPACASLPQPLTAQRLLDAPPAELLDRYARTSDPELRVVVVATIGGIAERREAVAFLEEVAKQDPASEDFPNAALWAFRTHPGMGG